MKLVGWTYCLGVLAMIMASPALASFPGRNGLLAVQPFSGPGLVLVDSHGGQERRICTNRSRCGLPRSPRWSPDGQVLVFNAANVNLIYPDGSCLNCQLGTAGSPAFTSNSTLVTFVSGGKLFEDGIDGIRKTTILSGQISDAVWSGQGSLAVVRSGRVWAGRPTRLRSIGTGTSPSWSPDGSRIAIQRGGWVVVVRVRNGSSRRLIRGGAPAWSPDGRSIALIGSDHHLLVVSASGGRARRVGRVRGVAVDWQPMPKASVAGCHAPPGSSIVASSPSAIVTGDANPASSAYMGCLRADGRERLLEEFGGNNLDNSSGVSTEAVAGDYAALVNDTSDPHYGGSSYTVAVFDLRTGAQVPDRGGESVGCPDFQDTCGSNIEQVVVGSNGVSAALTIVYNGDACPASTPICTIEQILASDSTGVHRLDAVSQPGDGLSSLTGLSLSGYALTWDHAGTPRSADLH